MSTGSLHAIDLVEAKRRPWTCQQPQCTKVASACSNVADSAELMAWAEEAAERDPEEARQRYLREILRRELEDKKRVEREMHNVRVYGIVKFRRIT